MQTFGASPGELMRGVFGAPDTVGQRATEFLDLLLMVAARPDQVQAVWAIETDEAIRQSLAFQQLWEFVQTLPHEYESDRRLLDLLRSVRSYTRKTTGRVQITVADVLEVLEDRLGPGYYQFEFRRRLHALRGRGANAASD
jgi:hypothetical protein